MHGTKAGTRAAGPAGCPASCTRRAACGGKLRQFAKSADPAAERQLAIDAVRHVQTFGGVLEHPAESLLWAHCGLPLPGRSPDRFGGWTAQVRQCDFGHEAEKLTWLYIVGVHPDDLPPLPPATEPIGVIKPQRGVPRDDRKIVTKAKREHTPRPFAEWLIETARRCRRALPGAYLRQVPPIT